MPKTRILLTPAHSVEHCKYTTEWLIAQGAHMVAVNYLLRVLLTKWRRNCALFLHFNDIL